MDERCEPSSSLFIIESSDRPGTYEVFHYKSCILVYRKYKRGIEIVSNFTGVSNEEIKLHIEAYAADPESIILYFTRLKFKTLKRLDRVMKKSLAFLDEDAVLDIFRKLRYIEDVHK